MRFLLLFLFLVSNLFASNFSDALELFEEKKYLEAYELFEKAFFEDMGNIEVNFYLGRTAFELKLFKEAQVAFDRVLMMNENHTRAKLELGRTLLEKGSLLEAEKLLNEALNSNPPEIVKQKIRFLLFQINQKKKKHYFNLMVSLGRGFETNINNTVNQDILVNYLYDKYSSYNIEKEDIETDEKLDSVFYSENMALFYKYKIDEKTFFTSNLNIYNHNYKYEEDKNTHQYNLFFVGGNFGIEKFIKNSKYEFLGTLGRVNFGNQHLLNVFAIKPKFSFFKKNGFTFESYYQHKIKKFVTSEYDGRDSFEDLLSFGFSKNMSKAFLKANYTYLIEEQINQDSTVSFIDNSEYNLKLNFMYELPFKIMSNFEYNRRIIKYNDEIEDNKKRKDIYSSYLVSLSKEITDDFELSLNFNYIDNESNYIPMNYDKKVSLVNLTYKY